MHPVLATSLARPVTPMEWARFTRVHQWSKNLLVFIPVIVGHAYADVTSVMAAVLAFLSLSLVASGTYVVNDILDVAADREHPTKRTRLLASGRVTPGHAWMAAGALVVPGMLMAAFARTPFVAMVVLYLTASLAYSLRIKRIAMVDVVVVGMLFTLRVAAGAVAAGLPHSPWLLSFSGLFFLSMAFAKRHAEVHGAARDGRAVDGRGYQPADWPLTLACGVASLFAAIVLLSLYLANEAVKVNVYANPSLLWATPVVIGTWGLRIWHLSHGGALHGDPVSFALRDRTSLVMGLIIVAIFVAASTDGMAAASW